MRYSLTLCAVCGVFAEAKAYATLLKEESKKLKFDSVFLASCDHRHSLKKWSKLETEQLSLDQYNTFTLYELHKHIATTHALTVQLDGRINNPNAFDQAWFNYDYIGAPWPDYWTVSGHCVGNSGFCMRSLRLLKATSTLPRVSRTPWHGGYVNRPIDDILTCDTFRETLVSGHGIKFATPEVAAKFSFELPTKHAKRLTTQFGYHQAK